MFGLLVIIEDRQTPPEFVTRSSGFWLDAWAKFSGALSLGYLALGNEKIAFSSLTQVWLKFDTIYG